MFFKTLSGRFLLLSFLFVMVAEILLFVPSVSNFRVGYLQERLELAQLASLALLATPDDMVAPELANELLKNAEVLNIVLRRDAVRELVLAMPIDKPISMTVDLRDAGFFTAIKDAVICAFAEPDIVFRVIGQPVKEAGIQIEIVLDAAPVKAAMLEYSRNVFFLSLIVSLVTGLLLFLSFQVLITRPITRVISSMRRFRNNPEDASNVIIPNAAREQVGVIRWFADERKHLSCAGIDGYERAHLFAKCFLCSQLQIHVYAQVKILSLSRGLFTEYA